MSAREAANRRRVMRWLSVRQVAALLDFSPGWVRDRIKAGEFGPAVFSFRGDVRVSARAVNEFVSRHQAPVTADARPAFRRFQEDAA